jgi:hypothetical protein
MYITKKRQFPWELTLFCNMILRTYTESLLLICYGSKIQIISAMILVQQVTAIHTWS